MVFNGFQKMTLLDFPGKVACTLFTYGCNLRCPFCHNALLVTEAADDTKYEDTEILDFLKKRTGLLDGVAITGGEPLLHKDIDDFISQVKSMGFKVKLDTNGCFPEHLEKILGANLVDYVAIDIKNSIEKYPMTVGVDKFDVSNVLKSIEILDNSNIEHEFRTTVVNEFHTIEDIEKISMMIKNTTPYFLQNFVDSGNLISNDVHGVPKNIMYEMEKAAKKHLDRVEIRGL